MARPRRALVTVLLVLGSVAALAFSFATWLDRQALSPSGWQATSPRLIASPQVRRGVATFAVDDLFARTHVAAALHSALPAAVADPALRTLRSLGLRLAGGILAGHSAYSVWETANRQAHRDLLAILEHSGRHGEVALNLTPLLDDLIRALDASAAVRAIPGNSRLFTVSSSRAGELPVLSTAQLDRARPVVNAIRGASVALALAAVILFALAILTAWGWRSIALRRVGYCLLAVGAVVLIARRLLAPALADALVPGTTYRRAADAAWTISTTELRSVAEAMLVGGAGLVLAGLISARRGASAGTARRRATGRGRRR